MDWETNFYYHPEKSDLTQIGMLDDPNASYSFDDLVVWQHEGGTVYWATDSGCSCPVPFERYSSLDELNKIDSRTALLDFVKAVHEHCAYDFESRNFDFENDPKAADKTELIAKVTKLCLHLN